MADTNTTPAPDSQGFSQVKIGDTGTYGAVNNTTGQAIAFSDPTQFAKYFSSFDANAPIAKFDTSGLLKSPNQVLNLNQISGNAPLDLNGTVPKAGGSASNPDAMVAGATPVAAGGTKTTQDYINEATPPKTDTQTKADALTGDISTLLTQDTGKTAAQQSAEDAAGVTSLKSQLADINSQIATRTAAYNKTYAQAENQSIPMSIIIGQQAQIKKAEASDIGLLQARALGLQGQVSAAQDTANRAVDLKYSTIEDQIKVKQAQLALLQPTLTAEEKAQATALDRQYADLQKAIDAAKAKEKANIATALQGNIKTPYANQNGEFFDVKTGVAFPDAPSFFKAAGVTSFADAYAKNLVSDVTPSVDLSKYPTSYQEYVLAKKEGFTGNYNQYQTMDANRKAKAAGGNLSFTDQQKIQQQADSSQTAKNLASKVGPDGYVSPQDWRRALNDWTSAGYSGSDFVANYKQYANPADPQDYGLGVKN